MQRGPHGILRSRAAGHNGTICRFGAIIRLPSFCRAWPAFDDVHGEGLLAVPTGDDRTADIVAIPDANQTPEQLFGLSEGIAVESQFARRLAENGCRVLVPALINRDVGAGELPNREFIYRSAFELGRHVIGYEVQDPGRSRLVPPRRGRHGRIGVMGSGEGGLLALCAAAIDPRIKAACVSGYFDSRQNVWQEPIDRNVFGFLEQFGDAELASLIAPRALVVEAAQARAYCGAGWALRSRPSGLSEPEERAGRSRSGSKAGGIRAGCPHRIGGKPRWSRRRRQRGSS